jgi:hypothetical protein
MKRYVGLAVLTFVLCCCACGSAFAQGPCASQSSQLACVIPQIYGVGSSSSSAVGFSAVLYHPPSPQGHPFHFVNSFTTNLEPLTNDIGREANLLPLASPSSGIILTFDPSLKTFVASTDDSLGPVLGERAETVGRHRLFVGFSYQFFNFTKLDGISLQDFPAVLTHTDDVSDDFPGVVSGGKLTGGLCSATGTRGYNSLNGCGFVRDRIETQNSISLKENQYTAYLTFGLTRRIDVSVVIPIENIKMAINSQATIVPGTDGTFTPSPGSPDAKSLNQCMLVGGQPGNYNCTTHGAPFAFHLFNNCPNTSPSSGLTGLDPVCLHHTFPDFAFAGSGSVPNNSASGIGDVVARVKWNAWEGERAGVAVGVDVRFPSGDALNFLGSGSYGVKPFAVVSYRARVSPHALLGVEFNSSSLTAGDVVQGTKGKVPDDLAFAVGADARVTRWLTADFDIVGQRIFDTVRLSAPLQAFLPNCGSCTSAPSAPNDMLPSLQTTPNVSYTATDASMGIKLRPIPGLSKLVLTANVLVRLNDGGLRSKAAPLVGLGYTF